MAEHCNLLHISHYLPLRQETKVYQRRRVTVEKPVFPGYFFCSIDHDDLQKLATTNHILRVLPAEATRLLTRQLVQLRRALRIDPGLHSRNALKRGKRVRIKQGPFMGVEGIVSTVKGVTSVCLNVELIGQAVAVEVDQAFIDLI
jgi:transcriptional antiterminator RfaH